MTALLVKQKAFPANYSASVLDVLERASLTGLKSVKIMGSASIRSQQYSGDFDAEDTVNITSFDTCAKDIQDVIKRIRGDCYITDFKIGEVPEWDVVKGGLGTKKKLNFKLPASLAVLDRLKAEKIISEAEYKGAERLLRNVDSPLTFIEARKGIRFHILRWKSGEILAGVKNIRGYKILLEDALASGGMVKLDLIASIDSFFTEFSMIYNLILHKQRITPYSTNAEVEAALEEDIIYYNNRNPFKAMKRAFSLAKLKNRSKELEKLIPILNSDLGRLYQIVGDLGSLQALLEQENPPVSEIKENLDEIKARMGSIYSLKEFLAAEFEILGRIESMMKMPPKTLKPALYSLFTQLQEILNEATLKNISSLQKV